MYGIIDCDNCYVSCERVFRPDLNGRPVVVLSNNDGCVVARSNEAKAMGIKPGTPYYQLSDQFPDSNIAVFSSNYELYGELTGRVMELIRQEAPSYFRYSIDECFVNLSGMPLHSLKTWGEHLHSRIKQCVGMPVSIGIAATKTLAKLASHYAKKYKGYHHCAVIMNEEQRRKALKSYPTGEVWGIGHRYSRRLSGLGIETALDFADKPSSWIRATFHNVVVERTWQELNGIDCIPDEEPSKKKSICTSRSFNGMLRNLPDIETHVANYASRCAEKLRNQGSVASIVSVFLHTNPFREDLDQYSNYMERRLLTPSSSTEIIVGSALACLSDIFRPGYSYKKAGVIVMDITPSSCLQQDLFDLHSDEIEKLQRIDNAIDKINHIYGTETIVLGSQQYSTPNIQGKADVFANAIKHEFRSKNPTTRWSDIIRLK